MEPEKSIQKIFLLYMEHLFKQTRYNFTEFTTKDAVTISGSHSFKICNT